MKRFCLLFLFSILTGIVIKAEEYRTLDLLGTWELTEQEGTNSLMRSIENGHLRGEPIRYMYLGEFSHDTHPSWIREIEHSDFQYYFLGALTTFNPDFPNNYYEHWDISAFWISDGNCLHILGADGYNDCNESFFFIIDSMKESELKLCTFDKKMRLTFKRISEPGNSVTVERPTTSETQEVVYSLDGIKVSTQDKGVRVVKQDNKTEKFIR